MKTAGDWASIDLVLHISFLTRKQKSHLEVIVKTEQGGNYSNSHTNHKVFQQLYQHQLVELLAKPVIKYLLI